MNDLVKRLRDWETVHLCDAGKPAGSLYVQAADRIAALEARIAKADALAEAGEVMSRALHGDYIVPGSATKWDAALAAYREGSDT